MGSYPFIFYFVQLFSLVLLVAILSRKENRRANLFLSSMIGFALLAQWVRFLWVTGEIAEFPYLSRVPFATGLLIPALFYLYALALTTPNFKWRKGYYLHLIPFGFGLLWNLVFLGSKPHPWEGYVRNILSAFILTAYLAATLILIDKYRRVLPHYFSEFHKVRLNWLKILLILFTVPWILAWVDVASGPFFEVERWMILTVNFILILIGFFGWRQSVIFSEEPGLGEVKPLPSGPLKSQRLPLFTPEELVQRKEKLEKFVSEKKPYLDPELRLVDLAGALDQKAYQVSEVLNRGLGLTFHDYINRFRIEEAKRRLLDPACSHLSILGIAMDSGFNSKSVFNESFRKITGMAPSAYRDSKGSM